MKTARIHRWPILSSATRTSSEPLGPNAGIREQRNPVNWGLAGLALSMLMASLDTSIANAGLPTLAHAFSATFRQVQWVVLSYLLAVTTIIVSVGRFGDIVGRRRLLIAGISLFTGASVACGAAPSLEVLMASRAVQGLGAAVMMSLSMASASEAVSTERIGRAMGLLGVMSAVGTAIGPSVGGLLVSAMGWRSIFLVNVPLGIVSLAIAIRHLPAPLETPKERTHTFDIFGTVLLAIALGAYALAMTSGRTSFGPANFALLAIALAAICLFVFVESRVNFPLIQPSILRSHPVSASLTCSAVVSTVMMSTLVVGPFYLSRALGLNAISVGLALSVGPLVVAINGVPAGRMSDRIGAPKMATYGLSTMVIGSLMLALTSPQFGVVGYIGPIIITTAGYAYFQTANNTSVMAWIAANQRGVVSGMLSLSRNLGLITGASAMGAVFSIASGSTDAAVAQPHAVALGMRVTFAVATVFLAGSLALFSRLRVHLT